MYYNNILIVKENYHYMARVHYTPPAAKRAVRKLGSDIKDARLSRRITATLLAERASISRPTLARVERGEPEVSIGIYAAVLQARGLVENLREVADIANDDLGRTLAREQLRAARPRRSARSGSAEGKPPEDSGASS